MQKDYKEKKSFMKKFVDAIGLNSEEEESNYIESREYVTEHVAAGMAATAPVHHTVEEYGYDDTDAKNKVIKIHTTAQLKLVIMQPKCFEEAKDIANHLKSKKPVVMNLESVDKDCARRIVDFLSGAAYAVDGNMQKVSNGIFLLAPCNIGIMGDFKDELRNKVFHF